MENNNMTPLAAFLNKPAVRSALRFSCTMLGIVLAVLILACCLMVPLRTYLQQYEATRPKYMAAEVYKMLFAEPDWAVLYNLAEEEGTEYEGRSNYVTYMTQKVGDQALTYSEIPAGLSGDRRYCVRLGNEPVAYFTLVSVDDGVSTFPYWKLHSVELCAEGKETVTVTVLPGHTVYINGVALREDQMVSAVTTPAEAHLPEGLHGYRYIQMQVTGLLLHPEVVAVDEYGTVVTLTRNPDGTFTEELAASTAQITEEEAALVASALEAEAQFSIRAITAGQLRQFFDPNSQPYIAMLDSEPLFSQYYSYEFDTSDVIVDQYWRYSDTVFSARASGTLHVMDYSGQTTSVPVCYSYLFIKNYAGDYVVIGRTEDDMMRRITTHRVSYSNGTDIFLSQMEPVEGSVNAPTISNGDSLLTGWAVRHDDGTLTTVLVPQEDGSYAWAEGIEPGPMTLYPVFE